MPCPDIEEPAAINKQEMLEAPPKDTSDIELKKGPNISTIPDFDAIEDNFDLPVLLKMGDNISTDEILAGGSRVLPYRSNIQKISTFAFEGVDKNYHNEALIKMSDGGHMVVAGHNYGQGSSREHAALAPRYLGLKVVLVKGFARIHLQNLINFGILPVTFMNEEDYERIEKEDIIEFRNIHQAIRSNEPFDVRLKKSGETIPVKHDLTKRHMDILLAGGIINWVKERQ